MVDEVTSVLYPLLDFILGLVEDGIDALAKLLYVLRRDVKDRLRVVWWDCKRCRNEGEEG